jgi:hypothetical protein
VSRTIERAYEILEEEGLHIPQTLGDGALNDEGEYEELGDWSGNGRSAEDRLGCSVETHERWMREADESDLRGWAQDWVRDDEQQREEAAS